MRLTAYQNGELTKFVMAIIIIWITFNNFNTLKINYRSRDFRPSYGHLHEIRAVVPKGTPLLACSATVTRSIRQEVIQSLEMVDCDFISTSPDRPNIFYEVHPRTELDSDMKQLLKSLPEFKSSAPCVIVYCCTLDMCADIRMHILTMS